MEKINFKLISAFSVYIFLSTVGIFIIVNLLNSFLPETLLDTVGNYSETGYLFMQNITNLITYFLLFIILIILFQSELITDFKKSRYDKSFNFKEIITAFLYLLIFSFLGNIITSFFTDTESINQSSIIDMILSKYSIYSIISTLFLVILVEEIIYRKALISFLKNFNFFNNNTIILISGFFFGIVHVIFAGDFFHFFSYFLPGIVLAFYYIKKNQNIWFSISLHFLNNLFSVISILILSLFDYSNL